jgi:hypothetical protein
LWLVQSTSAQTVFHYNYSASALPDIFDVSGSGNDAVAGPLAVLSNDVPTNGVPAGSGDVSLDSSDPTAVRANQAGAVTMGSSLLDNDLIEAAGGFTYETWFKWNGGGAVNSIIDYAGTDKIVIDQRNGASTTVAMRMDPVDLAIGDAVAGQWHYVAFVFDSSGNSQVSDTIAGNATAYFDSLEPINLGAVTKSAFGDSLIRPIGIGQHPIGFDLDFFDGSVYETRVSLGALGANDLLFVPEPSSYLTLTLGLVALLSLHRRRRKSFSCTLPIRQVDNVA